ncbi:MAG: hypothetical protein J5I65_09115 [Aridibacter famidurans]|nr:hypothetical protein [Aridibacter famidurans]
MLNRGSLAAFTVLPLLLTTVYAQSRATVTDAGAQLLKEPSRRSALLKPLPKGTEIEVENQFLDEDWTRVSTEGTRGWVRRERIRIKMDDPWDRAVWLFIGSTPKTNGFVVRFYLNTSQIVRRGDNIRFWTKMVPDNKEAYFDFIMVREPKRKPSEFRFNSDLWEGDCSTQEISVRRSLLYWNSNEVTRPNMKKGDGETSGNSAARVILEEACRTADRQF